MVPSYRQLLYRQCINTLLHVPYLFTTTTTILKATAIQDTDTRIHNGNDDNDNTRSILSCVNVRILCRSSQSYGKQQEHSSHDRQAECEDKDVDGTLQQQHKEEQHGPQGEQYGEDIARRLLGSTTPGARAQPLHINWMGEWM